MIITCPSCKTRYRQPPEVGDVPVKCSCSRCEAVFSSDDVPDPELSFAEPIPGDPMIEVSARLDPEPSGNLAPPVNPVPEPETERPISLTDLPIGMDDPTLEPRIRDAAAEAPAGTGVASYSVLVEDEPVKPAKKKPVHETRPVSLDRRPGKKASPGFFAFLIVMLLPAAMAAGAWQLSVIYREDWLIWTAPAGVLGLLFSWLWVRWKYREH